MSASMRVRIPPRAPSLVDVLGETGVVEELVWEALFGKETFVTPDESLASHDQGVTGGVTISATGAARQFLDGALAGLQIKEGSALPANELRYFLSELDKHGALLITKEH